MTEPNCKECGDLIQLECGQTAARHGYCNPCASGVLDDLLSRELTMHKHLRPVVENHDDGVWLNATATLGCVRADLARDYAAELLRAADEADQRSRIK